MTFTTSYFYKKKNKQINEYICNIYAYTYIIISSQRHLLMCIRASLILFVFTYTYIYIYCHENTTIHSSHTFVNVELYSFNQIAAENVNFFTEIFPSSSRFLLPNLNCLLHIIHDSSGKYCASAQLSNVNELLKF